jgi:glycosyltransferase involved in cell wall biosynthesis
MKCTGIHQLLPNLCEGDAISDYAVLLSRIWRDWGLHSTIYAENTDPAVSGLAVPAGRMPGSLSSSEVLVYHLSTGSDLAEVFAARPAGMHIVIYHNITPPALLASVPEIAARSHRGLVQLRDLTAVSDLAIADSQFNVEDLARAGYAAREVVHLGLSSRRIAALQVRPVSTTAPVILHVGRMLPHKQIERLVMTFGFLLDVCPRLAGARLRLVGDAAEAPDYVNGIRRLAAGRCLAGVEVAGRVSGPALTSEYGAADAYLCMSAHEGFCVPLVESMFSGIPIVASSVGAIPEVVDGAGLLFEEQDPALYAEALCRMLTDPEARAKVVAAQACRAKHFTQAALELRLRTVLARFLTGL